LWVPLGHHAKISHERPTGLGARIDKDRHGPCIPRSIARYRSGRSPDWLKFKNPDAPAVRREARFKPAPLSEANQRPQGADDGLHLVHSSSGII